MNSYFVNLEDAEYTTFSLDPRGAVINLTVGTGGPSSTALRMTGQQFEALRAALNRVAATGMTTTTYVGRDSVRVDIFAEPVPGVEVAVLA